MKKNKIKKINSFALLPNGIWLERGHHHYFCWYQQESYLTYSQDDHFVESNLYFIRAYVFLYNQIISKYIFLLNIKRQLEVKTKQSLSIPVLPILQNDTLIKIIITLIFLYYLINFQSLLQLIYFQNFSIYIAHLLSISTNYLFVSIVMFLIIRIFIPASTLQSIGRYNQALKDSTSHYARNNTIFFVISILIATYFATITNNLLSISFYYSFIIIYPMVFELLNYCEKHLANYLCFLVYSPIYILDSYFTASPTKKELKCITLALKNNT